MKRLFALLLMCLVACPVFAVPDAPDEYESVWSSAVKLAWDDADTMGWVAETAQADAEGDLSNAYAAYDEACNLGTVPQSILGSYSSQLAALDRRIDDNKDVMSDAVAHMLHAYYDAYDTDANLISDCTSAESDYDDATIEWIAIEDAAYSLWLSIQLAILTYG